MSTLYEILEDRNHVKYKYIITDNYKPKKNELDFNSKLIKVYKIFDIYQILDFQNTVVIIKYEDIVSYCINDGFMKHRNIIRDCIITFTEKSKINFIRYVYDPPMLKLSSLRQFTQRRGGGYQLLTTKLFLEDDLFFFIRKYNTKLTGYTPGIDWEGAYALIQDELY